MITDGTRIRLAYQVELWDTASDSTTIVDAGAEFIAIDGIDTTERGTFLAVVEPDLYASDEEIDSCLILDDLEAIKVIGQEERTDWTLSGDDTAGTPDHNIGV